MWYIYSIKLRRESIADGVQIFDRRGTEMQMIWLHFEGNCMGTTLGTTKNSNRCK